MKQTTDVPALSLRNAQRRSAQQFVPSPCVGICRMNVANAWCVGCFRTVEEISCWGSAPDAVKLGIWARVEQRQKPIESSF